MTTEIEYLKVQAGLITAEPIPDFLPISVEALANLDWTDPALGVRGMAWWPVENNTPDLEQHQRYGDETLTIDAIRRVVVRTRAVLPWSAEEIQAAKDYAAEHDPANRMTVYAFRNRFTETEKVAIELAALDDPSSTSEKRTAAAGVRAMLADLAAATYINRTNAGTRAGVERLEAAGIIGAGRAAAILDTPITQLERPTA